MRSLLLSSLCAIALFVPFTHTAHAQTAAKTGCKPITEAERAELKNAGSEVPTSGQLCDDDRNLLYGKCPESPYAYLEQKKLRAEINVARLNADFACRLYKFLKASDDAGMNIRITSAYRSVEDQAKLYANRQPGVPVAPPGRSRHNFGIAVDLTFDGKWPSFGLSSGNTTKCIATLKSCRWAHENSSTFGLRWPMTVEPWHLEPGTGVRGLEQLPSDASYWVSDEGALYNGSAYSGDKCLISTSPVMWVDCNQLSRQVPPPAFAPTSVGSPSQTGVPSGATTPSTQTQSQPQICTPSFSCTNGIMYYQTTQCTTQTYQVCAYGCSGNACVSATSTTPAVGTGLNSSFSSSSTSTNTNTNENTNTNADEEPQSISDLLSAISNPFSVIDIGTSTGLSFELNPDTGEVARLSPFAQSLVPTTSLGVIASVQPTGAQQTFTSSDLVNTPSPLSRQTSGFQQILGGLRQALEWAISTLKPFRGTVINANLQQLPLQ